MIFVCLFSQYISSRFFLSIVVIHMRACIVCEAMQGKKNDLCSFLDFEGNNLRLFRFSSEIRF